MAQLQGSRSKSDSDCRYLASLLEKGFFHGGTLFFLMAVNEISACETVTRGEGFRTVSEKSILAHGCIGSHFAKITLFLPADLLSDR